MRHDGISLSQLKAPSTFEVATVGVDLAKRILGIDLLDANGEAVVLQQHTKYGLIARGLWL
jgi:hypothetical protein